MILVRSENPLHLSRLPGLSERASLLLRCRFNSKEKAKEKARGRAANLLRFRRARLRGILLPGRTSRMTVTMSDIRVPNTMLLLIGAMRGIPVAG